MYAIPNTITITDLRRKSASLLKNLPREGMYLLIQHSRPKGAVVDLQYLKMLQEAYENSLDVQAFDQTIDEPRTTWNSYKKQSSKTP